MTSNRYGLVQKRCVLIVVVITPLATMVTAAERAAKAGQWQCNTRLS